MARRIEPHFVPNMDDCKMIVKCENGAICYIMDTCCRNIFQFTPPREEDKKRVDEKILQIYLNSVMRKRAKEKGQA